MDHRRDVDHPRRPRRNRNLRVEGPEGRGLFIKQADDSADGACSTLRCESLFHKFCREEPATADLVPFLARFVRGLDEEAILVFELIADATTLQIRLAGQLGRGDAIKAARAFGQALGKVHRTLHLVDPERDPRLTWLSRSPPAILGVHQQGPERRAGMSRADLEILRVLQTHKGFGEQIDRSKQSWRHETVIHGDIRFDNVLVRELQGDEETDAVDLWIVDWEMVRIGDPAWDLAGAFQDFLILWISSMPLSDELTAEEMTARSRVPLDELRTASRALWAGYRAGACLEIAEAGGFLRRAVSFSAIRLIQSAFEHACDADRLAGLPVLLLQMSANLLADPELAQVQLFGIPPESVAS